MQTFVIRNGIAHRNTTNCVKKDNSLLWYFAFQKLGGFVKQELGLGPGKKRWTESTVLIKMGTAKTRNLWFLIPARRLGSNKANKETWGCGNNSELKSVEQRDRSLYIVKYNIRSFYNLVDKRSGRYNLVEKAIATKWRP